MLRAKFMHVEDVSVSFREYCRGIVNVSYKIEYMYFGKGLMLKNSSVLEKRT